MPCARLRVCKRKYNQVTSYMAQFVVIHVVRISGMKVLEVVRSNYDSLTLKLQDNLDQYERYAEKPKETAFFTQLVIICFLSSS